MTQLLIVDDDAALGAVLERFLSGRLNGITVGQVESVADLRHRIEKEEPEVILTDLRLGDGSGLDVLRAVSALPSKPTVILLTGNATLESAIEALRLGAFDYLQKPYEEEHLLHTVRRAFESRRLQERVRDLSVLAAEDSASAGSISLVRDDPRTQKLFADAERLAAGAAPILLTGESGTGKEVVARHIHSNSPRVREPFVAINCAAIPETLLESELFGYEKGAFTGATAPRKGKFELAAAGTLFLDEIGELPLSLQPKLLRVLDGHGFLRLGGQITITADVRIIAATNRKIDDEVTAGRFREDLYYRLNVGRLDIPPLRERKADILPLASRILENLARKYRRDKLPLSDADRQNLMAYPWPGNVRELQNVLERAILLSSPESLELPVLQLSASQVRASLHASLDAPNDASLMEILESYERRLIQKSLKEHGGGKTAAAKALGLSKQLLNYKLKKYGLGS